MEINKSVKAYKRSGNFKRKIKAKLKRLSENVNVDSGSFEVNNFEEVEPSFTGTERNSIANESKVANMCRWEDIQVEENEICFEEKRNQRHEESDIELIYQFKQNFKKWATQHKIKHSALKDIMSLINNRWPNSLPVDPRTLLQTLRNIEITKVGTDGQYWHYGAKNSLNMIVKNMKNVPPEMSLNINIDGLPLYKSSKQEFWPILFNIHEMPRIKPMIIGIFYGTGKPSSLSSFLRPFVEEMKSLLQGGVEKEDDSFTVKIRIRCFICDSPARAFIKGVANFNAKHGCQKCTTIGEYSYISHCTYFPRVGCERRLDRDFRAEKYGSHHKTSTPLTDLPINMIEDFPVADSLHLIDLGIMKRCLLGWRDGTFGTYRTKWAARDSQEVSNFLVGCKMPSEIHRTVRSLEYLAQWKGNEYRTFLYYLSVVILKDVLPFEVYQHFLTFFCAVTICSSKKYFKFLDLAEALVDDYLEHYRDHYGEDYMTSNVHNLSHMVDDVRKFGELSSFSAYPFENRLFEIKNLIRSGNRPLAQVGKRLSELTVVEIENTKWERDHHPVLKIPHCDDTFKKIELSTFSLSGRDAADQWFLANDVEIVKMEYAVKKNSGIFIYGSSLKFLNSLFIDPINSSFLNIYSTQELKLNAPKKYPLKCIVCKMVFVKAKNKNIFIPLLHTLEK